MAGEWNMHLSQFLRHNGGWRYEASNRQSRQWQLNRAASNANEMAKFIRGG